jgi:alpha/beta superfamily hydrolase
MDRPINAEILGDRMSLSINEVRRIPVGNGYDEVTLVTSRGETVCRYYLSSSNERAVVMVGGVGGGFDSPAKGLYSALTSELVNNDYSVLRIRYRYPTDLTECTMDVLAGLQFLKGEGIRSAGLIGHSLGGAVVIQAAARCSMVRTIITLSTQSYGADALQELEDGVASLFIHGGKDWVLPSRCSSYAYGIAKEPKELIIHHEADHSLDQSSESIYNEVLTWIKANLR